CVLVAGGVVGGGGGGADQAGNGGARGDAHAHRPRVHTRDQCLLHFHGAGGGHQAVHGEFVRRAEFAHNAVAHIFIDMRVVGEHDGLHVLQVTVQVGHHVFRLDVFSVI